MIITKEYPKINNWNTQNNYIITKAKSMLGLIFLPHPTFVYLESFWVSLSHFGRKKPDTGGPTKTSWNVSDHGKVSKNI